MTKQGIAKDAEKLWEHAGLECCTVRNPFGGLNAYVRLPEPFRSRKLSYDDISYEEVSVSGGLTYGMDKAGWVGWDTLHLGDVWHDPGEIRESMRDSLCGDDPGRTWTPAAVEHENNLLAEQLSAWCLAHPNAQGSETPGERMARIREEMRQVTALTEQGVPFGDALERVYSAQP